MFFQIWEVTVCNLTCTLVGTISRVSTDCRRRWYYALLYSYLSVIQVFTIHNTQCFWNCILCYLATGGFFYLPIYNRLRHCSCVLYRLALIVSSANGYISQTHFSGAKWCVVYNWAWYIYIGFFRSHISWSRCFLEGYQVLSIVFLYRLVTSCLQGDIVFTGLNLLDLWSQ